MTKQCRSCSTEFECEAADLVLKQNYGFIEASRLLDVGKSALRRWVVGSTKFSRSTKALPHRTKR